jgi:hypothetical protein
MSIESAAAAVATAMTMMTIANIESAKVPPATRTGGKQITVR